MKTHIACLILLLAASAVSLPAVSAQPARIEFLADFEKPGSLADWQIYATPETTALPGFDAKLELSEDGAKGRGALRVSCSIGNEFCAGGTKQLSVFPGERYRVSAQVKVDRRAELQQPKSNVYMRVCFRDPDTKQNVAGGAANLYLIAGGDPRPAETFYTEGFQVPYIWTTISGEITVPEGAGYLSLDLIQFDIAGASHWDEVRVERVR